MSELVYTRVSTDEQSTQRQTHLLTEAGLDADADGVRLSADPATSSKIPALDREGFQQLGCYAPPSDRLTVSELYRLCRDLTDILAVRELCRSHGVKLRVLSGPLSGIADLARTDASTTMLVDVLVSVGRFQHDLQKELTRDGLAAAWAGGATSGRRPRLAQLGATDQVRDAFGEGASIASLARQYQVSRVAIRTAVADLIPGRPPPTPTVNQPQPICIEMPGKVAQYLASQDNLSEKERHTLTTGHQVRRGQRHTLHVTAPPDIHHALLTTAATRSIDQAPPAARKAYRIYAQRLNHAATPTTSA